MRKGTGTLVLAGAIGALTIGFYLGARGPFRPKPMTDGGVLVGLGDSVAAGYGPGPAEGYPDNPTSYPLQLSRKLGATGYNFAISGACVATAGAPDAAPDTPSTCTRSVITDELPLLQRTLKAAPRTITITVGANDVQLVVCFGMKFSPIELPLLDPCAENTLAAHLATLERNLDTLLSSLKTTFPSARIVITGYYNPVPAIQGDVGLCPWWEPVAAAAHPLSLVSPLTLGQQARAAQLATFEFGRATLQRLDEMLTRAAAEAHATFVTFDFTGHDWCRALTGGSAGDAWIYGPSLQMNLTLQSGGVAAPPRSWNMVMPSACPLPGPEEHEPFHGSHSGSGYTFDATFAYNCSPHPTARGSAEMATVIQQALR